MRKIDGKDVLEDGESVRVPLMLCDSRQFDATGHRPGFAPITDAVQQQRQQTRDRYISELTNSWRVPAQRPMTTEDAKKPKFGSFADANQRRSAAYDAYVKRIGEAWRMQPRDQEPDDDLMQRHLRTEPDDDAQARRNAAWAQYRDRLSNAWKTDPRTASAIERQGEQWRGGR
jgi:hypothetical protein